MTDDLPIQYRHYLLASAIQYVDATPDEPCVALYVNTQNHSTLTRFEQLVSVTDSATKRPRLVHYIVPESDLYWTKQELEDTHSAKISEVGKTLAFGSTIGVVNQGADLKDKIHNFQIQLTQENYFNEFVPGYLNTREGHVDVFNMRTVKEPYLTANGFLHRVSLGYGSLKEEFQGELLKNDYVRRGLKQKYMDASASILYPMHRSKRRSIYADYLATDPCEKEKDIQQTFEKLRGPAGNLLETLRRGLNAS